MTSSSIGTTVIGGAPAKGQGSVWVRAVRSVLKFGDWLGNLFQRQWQNILTALIQIWANKARSALTTLGVIIAVASTITVVSFVEGFGNHVTAMLRGFGTNMIFVIPQSSSRSHGRMIGWVMMDIDDIRAVTAQCDKVRRITPLIFTQATVEYGRERTENLQMRGASEQFQTVRNLFVDKGRFFTPIEVDRGASVCALGRGVTDLIHADEEIVGEHIYINQVRFRVLGLLERKGEMMGHRPDNLVIIPYTTAIKMQPFMRRFLPFVVEATDESQVGEASLQITRVLRKRHNIKPGQPNDFRLLRQDEFLRDFERVKTTAASVLTGIVGISLIVGGIGIMNVMLVSVTERTHEIGLRKSVGARRRDVLLQFLTEAVVLATVGGVVGILLGYAICAIASQYPDMVDVQVPLWSVVLALGFSAVVGVVSGIVPAFKAAIIHPIDALRHE